LKVTKQTPIAPKFSSVVLERPVTLEALAEAIAARTGTDLEQDMYPRILAGAVIAAAQVAVRRWSAADPPVPLGPPLRLPGRVRGAVRDHPAHRAEHLRDHRPAGQTADCPGMNPPRGNADARRAVILDAALRVFGQYGYRRTSMDDIAREAQIAKGTIYLSFASKEEVFQALSRSLSQRMLAGAGAARRRPGTTADKLAAMNAAWFGTYAETIRRSPHAAELLDAKHRLSADLVADAASRYKQLVQDLWPKPPLPGNWTSNRPASRRTPPLSC
jgi:Bacterial regulatory proteins, tetR family/MftR C-terminal domain